MSEGAELNPDEAQGPTLTTPHPPTPPPSHRSACSRAAHSPAAVAAPHSHLLWPSLWVRSAEGEGDFFFDSASLQVAPGVDLQALMGGAAAMDGGEGEGEDDDFEGDEADDGEGEEDEGADVTGPELAVTGQRVALSRGERTTVGMEEEAAGADDDVEQKDS